jgi:hypothetical protein
MLAFRKKDGPPSATKIRSPAAAPFRPREPTALLGFVAGEFADDIARLWPAPHTPFLTAEAPRRHLACLTLALDDEADRWRSGAERLRQALEGPFKRAVRALAPSAPAGLTRALARLGEQAWSRAQYRLLAERLRDPASAKVLNHAQAIAPRDVQVLSNLPAPVIGAGGGRLRLSEDQALLLAECFEGLARRDGVEATCEIARRWAESTSAAALFAKVGADLSPRSVAPPLPGTDRLVPLASRKDLAEAGRRFRNCLGGRVLDGWNHYYEWRGRPPAVACIVKDHVFGWSLDEALGVENRPIPVETQGELAAELTAMGVHVGRSAWQLKRLTDAAARPGFKLTAKAEEVDQLFAG